MARRPKPPTTLRAMRKALGLTQKQLGDRVGASDACINRWERGVRMPNIDNISLLAQAYGVTCDQIIRTFVHLHCGAVRSLK